MKKLFISAAILLGAVTVSRAGVRFDVGIGIPLPGVVVGRPLAVCAPAPVYYHAPTVYYQSPPAVYCPPQVYCPAPAVVVAPPAVYLGFGPFWHGREHWGAGWGWHHRR